MSADKIELFGKGENVKLGASSLRSKIKQFHGSGRFYNISGYFSVARDYRFVAKLCIVWQPFVLKLKVLNVPNKRLGNNRFIFNPYFKINHWLK